MALGRTSSARHSVAIVARAERIAQNSPPELPRKRIGIIKPHGANGFEKLQDWPNKAQAGKCTQMIGQPMDEWAKSRATGMLFARICYGGIVSRSRLPVDSYSDIAN